MRIVLASASPRRRELLGQIGLEFETAVSNVREETLAAEPWRMAEELSAQKAEAVFALQDEKVRREQKSLGEEKTLQEQKPRREQKPFPEETGEEGGLLVIGADTVVAADGCVLGKPADPADAARMLEMLSGRSHEVYTGVTLIHRSAGGRISRKTFHERTEVSFYPMSGEEIARYVSTGDCMDKAGAYGIQGFCARYVRELRGEYSNVVGLPVGRLYQEIKEWLV